MPLLTLPMYLLPFNATCLLPRGLPGIFTMALVTAEPLSASTVEADIVNLLYSGIAE